MTTKNRTTKTSEKPKGSAPSHIVYHVRGEGERKSWDRCGVAWQHGDGKGFNIVLSTIPVDGKLTVREPNNNEAGEAAGQ